MARVLRGVGIVAALALSAVALGIAASVGPARWGKDGLTLGVAAGTFVTIAIVAGLILVTGRTASRPLSRAALLVGGGIGVLVVAFPAAVAVWAAYPPHAAYQGGRPAGAIDVSVDAGEGVTLAGWYVPTTTGAAVVLAHGAGSTRDAVVTHAEVLAEAGYGVLAIDARGHGDSTGRAMDLGWWGEADLAAALDTLSAIDGVDPERLGLVGLSMGGESAVGAAGADPRARAVVAEGATQRTSADKAGWLPSHPLGWLQRGMDLERDALVVAMTDAPRPGTLRDAAAATRAPILLISSGKVPDEAMASTWVARGTSHVETWEIPSAAHTGGLATEPEVWPQRVIAFLDAALEAPAD
ncbi:alpha/beta hydrolase [Demequina sp. SO4-18]|uniref:alpha/beta hydrolase n=1 Tax=Demequina sp. SO4-18 TaxID=3401026 RepID=UPI003B595A8B